jgi:hypothetical protein
VIVNVACVMLSVWPPFVMGTTSAFAVDVMPLVNAICAGARLVDVESEHAPRKAASDKMTAARDVERTVSYGLV